MKYFAYILLILIVTTGSACQKTEEGRQSVRIGLIAYTEDIHQESVGVPTLNAARMATSEKNASGGVRLNDGLVPVELIVERIASSPQNAVASVRKLTNREKVSAIIGLHFSVDAIPAGIFADKAHTPFISPMSTNSRTTQERKYVFRMSFVDEQQGSVMARFAYQDLNARRAAVMFDRSDPYSNGISEVFAATFRDLGGAVVSYQPFVSETLNYEAVFQEISQSNPDVLYLPGFEADVRRHVKFARSAGFDVQFLGADGWNATEFSQLADFNSSYMTAHWMLGQDSEAFGSRYYSEFNKQPDAVAALTYDAMNILFAAIEYSGRADSESIRQALFDMDVFQGVAGKVDFVDSGDPVKGVLVLRLHDGNVLLERLVNRGEF